MAVVYGLAQLLVLDGRRFLPWDEAVYVAEVSPFADAVGMGAHRARGITYLVAPVTMLTESMPALRVYLAIASSAALFGAFFVWCRSIGWAAPTAAAVFASSWITLFYGSAAYPNLYSALLAVAVLGLAWLITTSPNRSRLLLLSALVAATVLVRPLDAALVAVSVLITGVVAGQGLPALGVATASGVAVGAVPWVVESWARFGGPLQRLEISGETVGGGLHNNLQDYLRLLDGTAMLNVVAVASLGALVILGLLGFAGHDGRSRRASLVSMTASALLAAPYLFATEPLAQRFLLPALALLCLASGLGVTAVFARLGDRRGVAIVLTSVLVLVSVWNVPAIRAWDDRQVGNTETARTLGDAIEMEAGPGSCFFLSPTNHPAIAFASGCRGAGLGADVEDNRRRIESVRNEGARVFVVTNSVDPGVIVGDGWICRPIPSLAERGWQLCAPADQ